MTALAGFCWAKVWMALRSLWTAMLKNPFTMSSVFSGYLWGFALAAPGDTLERPTYRHMAEIGPEDMWTAIFLVTASLQLWRIFIKTTPRLFPFEYALKLWASILWMSVGVMCMASQWPLAAAMSDTLVIALFAWIDLAKIRPCSSCPHRGRCKKGGCFYEH